MIERIIDNFKRNIITLEEMMSQLLSIGFQSQNIDTEEKAHEWLTICLHGQIKNAWSVAFDFVQERAHNFKRPSTKCLPLHTLIDKLLGEEPFDDHEMMFI